MPRVDIQREWREGIVAHAGLKAGEYFFATGGSYPVDRLRLNLPQPNTVAPAVVYSRAGLDAPWREVTSATLFRLHNGTVEQSNPSLELEPDTDRQWRVVVDTHNGGFGSGALTVAAGWRPATLTFVARGSSPFTLAVGRAAGRVGGGEPGAIWLLAHRRWPVRRAWRCAAHCEDPTRSRRAKPGRDRAVICCGQHCCWRSAHWGRSPGGLRVARTLWRPGHPEVWQGALER